MVHPFKCDWLYRRRQEAQRMGKTPWPPDWGPGDASRFAEFPELPKSRTQLVPPEKARSMRDALDRKAVRQRSTPQQDANQDLSMQDVDNMTSADLDAMIFKQRPYARSSK